MPGIFISYRREDTSPYAGRLYDHLSAHFGADRVFMDLDTIRPGDDFVQVISDKVAACDVLIALIGKQWVRAVNSRGHRRLDDPNDFVRIEIVSALNRKVRVIPALIEDATMPEAGELPKDIAPLTRRNAIEIKNSMFRQNVARLIQVIEETVGPKTAPGFLRPFQRKPGEAVAQPARLPGRLPLPGLAVRPGVWNWRMGAVAGAFLLIQILYENASEFPSERFLFATLLECLALFMILRARAGQIERQSILKFTGCWRLLDFGVPISGVSFRRRIPVFHGDFGSLRGAVVRIPGSAGSSGNPLARGIHLGRRVGSGTSSGMVLRFRGRIQLGAVGLRSVPGRHRRQYRLAAAASPLPKLESLDSPSG
jgi:hypothetical protein